MRRVFCLVAVVFSLLVGNAIAREVDLEFYHNDKRGVKTYTIFVEGREFKTFKGKEPGTMGYYFINIEVPEGVQKPDIFVKAVMEDGKVQFLRGEALKMIEAGTYPESGFRDIKATVK